MTHAEPERSAVTEVSAGGVVFRRLESGVSVLLIRDAYGHLGLPKGHLEADETSAAAAVREVQEETGLMSLRIVQSLRTIDWYFLSQLSDDAVPTLESRLGTDQGCALSESRRDPATWLEWNLGRSRAESLGLETSTNAVYEQACPGQTDD